MSEVIAENGPKQQEAHTTVLPLKEHPPTPSGRLAAWLQFPRRVVLLLIAFALVTCLISGLPALLAGGPLPPALRQGGPPSFVWWWQGTSYRLPRPITDMLGDDLPDSLLLLGAALLLALFFALVMALLAALVHWLEKKVPPLGSILKGLGRLICFGSRTAPVFVLGTVLIYVFALKLELLPPSGMFTPEGGAPGDRLQHLILPALTLAMLPSLLTAQAVAREVTLVRAGGTWRIWLGGLLRLLGTLLGQIGGLLSAQLLVEIVFAWPGLGRMLQRAALNLDLPVFVAAIGAMSIVVLVGRLLAELFRWLERLLRVPPLIPQPPATRWRKIARGLWVALALLLLLLPLGLAVAGLAQGEEAYLRQDRSAVNAPPSPDHPWGTDRLGRDVRARVLGGSLITLGTAAAVAALTLLPAGLCGALLGFLFARRTWWAESIADLLLLPADVLLFIPAAPAAMLALMIARAKISDWPTMWLMPVVSTVAVVVLARLVRVYPTLWLAAPERRRWLTLLLGGGSALLLGGLFAAFWLVAAVDFLGMGAAFPLPTLGGIVGEDLMMLIVAPQRVIVAGIVLWLCAFALYAAADALVGFFHTKEALVRLNE